MVLLLRVHRPRSVPARDLVAHLRQHARQPQRAGLLARRLRAGALITPVHRGLRLRLRTKRADLHPALLCFLFLLRYGQLYVNSEVLIENARTYLWGKNPQNCAKVRTFWWVFLPHLMDTEGAKNPPKCANLAHFDLSDAAGSTGLLICERR